MTEETQTTETQTTNEQLEEQIRASLKQVVDPEIGLDVITLGLIKTVDFPSDDEVDVDMLLTTPFCPYAPWMVEQVKEKTHEVVPDREVDVEVLAEEWNPSMMEDPSLLGFGDDGFGGGMGF